MQESLRRPTVLIDRKPAEFASEIARFVEQAVPTLNVIRRLGDQLLGRHAMLRGLKPIVSGEEIVESFFRCHVIDYVQRQFGIAASNVPRCVNSSHRATRRTCSAPAAHSHDSIDDSAWQSGWEDLQQRHPEVNIRASRSDRAKHADLYLVVQNTIVSFEFKYVGRNGLDHAECAAQVERYIAAGHAASILVVYSLLMSATSPPLCGYEGSSVTRSNLPVRRVQRSWCVIAATANLGSRLRRMQASDAVAAQAGLCRTLWRGR